MTRRRALAVLVALGASTASPCALSTLTARAAEASAPNQSDASARAQAMIDRGLAYLKSQQKPDGSWQNEKDPPAMTAIVLTAFVRDDRYDANTDFVKRGYDKLLSYQLDDGGIYKDTLA